MGAKSVTHPGFGRSKHLERRALTSVTSHSLYNQIHNEAAVLRKMTAMTQTNVDLWRKQIAACLKLTQKTQFVSSGTIFHPVVFITMVLLRL